MNRFFLGLLFVISYPFASAQTKPADKAKVKYDYSLYLPKDYQSTSRSYPLVIYLHGGSQRGNDLTKLNEYGPPQLVHQGKAFPFLIASPQCPAGKYWSTDNWLDSLYSDLLATYRIDPKRVYLTGISMGGYGTWQTAVAYPDKFAAIVPLCGGCDDSTQICRIKHLPVWTFHGMADDKVPFGLTDRLVKRLRSCSGKDQVRFTKLVNEGHEIQYLYQRKKIYRWLLRQHQ
ncbi:carboxylesterase family protein [Spirosoma utsteinense]|uniref:carboxylesterase family protein n=1 Tax=Spirosoma utsteinense TaxID=2585773 RepID=UPI0016449B79|nr:PHB depolymerase family esterase [Spirosoma utsteinense]MBC3789008.1 putative peptidase [Spirosoma utsteinense]